MKVGIGSIVIGVIVLTLGIVFHLQGHSVVGPESSFMYSNPDWIDYGMIITIVGAVIMGGGFVLITIKRG